MLCRWKERGGVGQTRQQQVRLGFAGAKFGLNLWQGCRPSPATLPGRRCTVTPARWLSLGIRGSWLYPGVGAPGGSDGGTLTPSQGCPAGRYRRHPREEVIRYRVTEGALHPSRESQPVWLQVSEGDSAGVGSLAAHTCGEG